MLPSSRPHRRRHLATYHVYQVTFNTDNARALPILYLERLVYSLGLMNLYIIFFWFESARKRMRVCSCDRNTTSFLRLYYRHHYENIPVLLIIPAQLRITYSEYVSISWTDFLKAVELSTRESKNACAVSGDASWCSSAAAYMAAMDARLVYQAIWQDRTFRTKASKRGEKGDVHEETGHESRGKLRWRLAPSA